MSACELIEVTLFCNMLSMYTFARGGLRQRVFAGQCSVMHQWHTSLASSAQPNLLEYRGSLYLKADDESPFFWNGTLVDVDAHLQGAADCDDDNCGGDDDWGLNSYRLVEEVAAANAR